MVTMVKIKVNWAGFQGAPGLSAFYFRDFEGNDDQLAYAQNASDKVNYWCENVATVIPSGVTLKVATDVELIESESGELVDVGTITSATTHSNNGHVGQAYAAAAGAVINWRTASVHRGRRVRGRTFLVPLAGTEFESNGTLGGNAITKLTAAANALLLVGTAPRFGVWARPQIVENADGSRTKINNGQWYPATSFNVPDMSAVLRSRRD